MAAEELCNTVLENGGSAGEEPSAAYMLTEDVLILIFELLPFRDRIRARKVCRAWQRAVDGTWSSTKKLDFKTETWSSDDSRLTVSLISEVIERCGRFLNDVDLREYTIRIVGDGMRAEDIFDTEDVEGLLLSINYGAGNEYLPKNKIIPSLIKHCSNLTRLVIHNVNPRETDLENLFLKNQGLKSLSIIDSGMGWSLLSIPQCLESFELQKALPMYTLTCFIPGGLCPVIGKLENLKHVKLTLYFFLTPDEIESLQTLKHLESYALIEAGFMSLLNDLSLPYYLNNVPEYANLRSLTLHNQPSCTDEYLKSVAEHCDMVETLSLSYSDHVSDSGLSSLLNLGSIKRLSICRLKNVTTNSLNNARNLIELNCIDCRGIDEYGLFNFIACSETLSVVNIRGCFIQTQEWAQKFKQLSAEKGDEELKITVDWAEE